MYRNTAPYIRNKISEATKVIEMAEKVLKNMISQYFELMDDLAREYGGKNNFDADMNVRNAKEALAAIEEWRKK